MISTVPLEKFLSKPLIAFRILLATDNKAVIMAVCYRLTFWHDLSCPPIAVSCYPQNKLALTACGEGVVSNTLTQ